MLLFQFVDLIELAVDRRAVALNYLRSGRFEPDDSEPADSDNEKMFESLVNRLRVIAIHGCHVKVQVAEELAGEAALHLHREKPWRRPEYSTYGGVVAWVTVVAKNIRNRK